jgi:hypothetical protein
MEDDGGSVGGIFFLTVFLFVGVAGMPRARDNSGTPARRGGCVECDALIS